jgi:hypothetical protein
MASKPETVFYTAINKLLPRELHKEKMNNPYRGGTADFWYSGRLGDIWVEYKWLPKVPKSAFEADLSELQLKWLRERHDEGRNVAVIIGSPDGVMILKNKTWIGLLAPEFTFTRKDTADWIVEETTP